MVNDNGWLSARAQEQSVRRNHTKSMVTHSKESMVIVYSILKSYDAFDNVIEYTAVSTTDRDQDSKIP